MSLITFKSIQSSEGLELLLCNVGARIAAISKQSEEGTLHLHQYITNPQGYYNDYQYSGPVIGVLGNRIRDGKASIDGNVYNLPQNQSNHCLHMGKFGIHLRIWELLEESENHIKYGLHLKHLEDGLPGERKITVTYRLTDTRISIEIAANTTQTTPFNLVSHPYFTLDVSGTLNHHELKINSDQITDVDQELLTTGNFIHLENSELDYRVFKSLENQNLDHNFILECKDGLMLAAELKSNLTQNKLRVWTDYPGLQVYTGKGNHIAIEPQYYPNSLEHPHFPSILFDAGKAFKHRIVYDFDL